MDTLSPVALCARALLKIGAEPIQSFADGSLEAKVAAALYDGVRDRMLCASRWAFATTLATLPTTPSTLDPLTAPDHERVVYRLPARFLQAIEVRNPQTDAIIKGYRIVGNTLELDPSLYATPPNPVTLVYMVRVDEAVMPSYFLDILVCALAAEFATPVAGSLAMAERFTAETETLLARARKLEHHHDTRIKRARDLDLLLHARR